VTAVLDLRGIEKSFGAVQALRGANFLLRPGEVHALLGENGAGKTTLMEVAYGMIRPDAGQILSRGQTIEIRSPRDARAAGIGMVHQHFTSVPALTVEENIALAAGRRTPDHGADDQLTQQLRLGLDPRVRVEDLSVGLRQRLEIVKALASGARILLLDEPTSVLAPAETAELLTLLRGFAASGGSVVLITHKLAEVFACADTVTVLRHGRVTTWGPLADHTMETLAEAMFGGTLPEDEPLHPLSGVAPTEPSTHGPVVRLSNVSVPALDGRGPGLVRATLEMRAGECVAIAAIDGNGQRELMLMMAGLLPAREGTAEIATPVVLVPADRTTEGLIGEFSLTENVVLGLLAGGVVGTGDQSIRARGWIDWAQAEERTQELVKQFNVHAPGVWLRAGALSGGNQQKLILGRALEQHPAVLIAENPTRGLDIQAAMEIRQHLREAVARGTAVLFYSSDLDEVLSWGADRLLVLASGEVRELPATADRDQVGRAMLTPAGSGTP